MEASRHLEANAAAGEAAPAARADAGARSSDFASVKARLDEIVDEISQEGVSLDDALALYEEAVKLGLAACDLSEADILPPEPEPEPEPAAGTNSAESAALAEAAENADPAESARSAEAAEPVEGASGSALRPGVDGPASSDTPATDEGTEDDSLR